MNWSSLAGSLANLGLTGLGTAFGGPLGATIGAALGSAVATALGVDATPEAVQKALDTNPEAAKAQLADMESARRADVDQLKIEADSSASARQMQIVAIEHNAAQENTPMILAYLNFTLVAAVIMGLLYIATTGRSVDLPPGLRELLTLILGIQLGCLKDSQGFFFGTSRSSERNGAAMRSIAQSANVPTPAQQVGAALGAAVKQAVKK